MHDALHRSLRRNSGLLIVEPKQSATVVQAGQVVQSRRAIAMQLALILWLFPSRRWAVFPYSTKPSQPKVPMYIHTYIPTYIHTYMCTCMYVWWYRTVPVTHTVPVPVHRVTLHHALRCAVLLFSRSFVPSSSSQPLNPAYTVYCTSY